MNSKSWFARVIGFVLVLLVSVTLGTLSSAGDVRADGGNIPPPPPNVSDSTGTVTSATDPIIEPDTTDLTTWDLLLLTLDILF